MRAKVLSLFVLAGFLALVFFMNWTYVFCSDDCFYGVMWNGTAWQRVGSVWNAFMIELGDVHRPFVHFISRVFCGCFPKWVFNICNTLAMGVLIILINRVAVKSWRPDWKTLSVMCGLVFFVLCKGESYLWGCGSINYLWTGAMTLWFCIVRERLENDLISARMTWLLVVPVALVGSANEAFSPPVCFGLALTSLIKFKELNWKKLLIYGAYGLAAIVLCVIEARRRASNVPTPSPAVVLMSMAKVAFTCKCVWALAVVFVLSPRKIDFIRENVFELVVIASSMVIGVAIGFVGERILWIANLMSIVVIVRECQVRRFWALTAIAALVLATAAIVPRGIAIRHNYDMFIGDYGKSPSNVVCLDYVPCGVWTRFFFQVPYQWQAMGYHPHAFSRYYGRPEVYPLGLTRMLFDKVYTSDAFRHDFTKLPLPFEAYEAPNGNTVVIPIEKGGALDRDFNEVSVSYEPLTSVFDRLVVFLSSFGRPILPFPDYPVRLRTSWGECWLVARNPAGRLRIRDVVLKVTSRKHPDAGMWWCAEPMKHSAAPLSVSR